MMLVKSWQKIENISEKTIGLPQFDVQLLKENGRKNPVWLHFGGGNLYRGFHAEIAQNLADVGELTAGVVVCETFDEEVISSVYHPNHDDILEVVMHDDGTMDKRILASTAASLYCQPAAEDYQQIIHYFENPSLQFVTLTITEKGYGLFNNQKELFPIVQEDIKNGVEKPRHTMSILAALLYKRYQAGQQPIAIVSTDNFSQNGKRLLSSISTIAKGWVAEKFVPEDFILYLENKVSFPWSMIDRITPNPAKNIQKMLLEEGFSDMEIIHTKKHTTIAPFVNTESVHYLVIEDDFPNGRPNLERAGVMLTNRETVDKIDTMKVTTCLNPLHTALAITGCLFGYQKIYEEMKDVDLVKLIKGIGYQEGLPVVENPGIIQPKAFIDEVINNRLTNENIPDTPQRIASDTSQKLAIRFGETIKKYQQRQDKKIEELQYIPWVLAAWLRYLLAVDDSGKTFAPSPDPLLKELQEALQPLRFGSQDEEVLHHVVEPILSNPQIFGINLYEVNLGKRVEDLFAEMLGGSGAVRSSLQKQLQVHGGMK